MTTWGTRSCLMLGVWMVHGLICRALGVHLQLSHQRLWERPGRHRLDPVGTDKLSCPSCGLSELEVFVKTCVGWSLVKATLWTRTKVARGHLNMKTGFACCLCSWKPWPLRVHFYYFIFTAIRKTSAFTLWIQSRVWRGSSNLNYVRALWNVSFYTNFDSGWP